VDDFQADAEYVDDPQYQGFGVYQLMELVNDDFESAVVFLADGVFRGFQKGYPNGQR